MLNLNFPSDVIKHFQPGKSQPFQIVQRRLDMLLCIVGRYAGNADLYPLRRHRCRQTPQVLLKRRLGLPGVGLAVSPPHTEAEIPTTATALPSPCRMASSRSR